MYSGDLSGKLYNLEFALKSQILDVSFSIELCQASLVVCRKIGNTKENSLAIFNFQIFIFFH